MSSYRRRLMLANQMEYNLYLYGNSVQDGTPTPDAPIEIMSLENPTIKVIGDNLLPYPYEISSTTVGGVDVTVNADGSILLNGTSIYSSVYNLNLFWTNPIILPAGDYTIGGLISKDCYLVLVNVTDGGYKYTLTKNITVSYTKETQIRLCIQFVAKAVLDNVLIKPFIMKSDKYNGSWEPYEEELIPVEGYTLKGVKGFKDRIYTKDGKVWHEKKLEWYETESTDFIAFNSDKGKYGLQLYIVDHQGDLSALSLNAQEAANNPGQCSHFTYSHLAYRGGGTDVAIIIGTTSKRFLWFITTYFEGENAANAWMKNNKITAIYPLATPVITEITGQVAEKILSIDKSKNITIYSDNGIQGSVEVIEE